MGKRRNKARLSAAQLRSNSREDIQIALDTLINQIEDEFGKIGLKLISAVSGSIVQGPVGQRGEQGETGVAGPPGSVTVPITVSLVPVGSCSLDLGSPTARWRKIYTCDATIEFETASLSVLPSVDRPGERGLFFQDNLGSDPVELTPKPKAEDVSIDDAGNYFVATNVEDALQELFAQITNFTAVFRGSDQITPIGGGEYQTPEDFSPDTLIVYRNGQVVDFTGINRINITGPNKFKFNLAASVSSSTMVSASYSVVF